MLRKLTLSGIRSYSEVAPQEIEFMAPLTIILGSNGSGKTTIVEAIQYALTGSFPPLSDSGKRFVREPEIEHQQSIKAKIALVATGASNQDLVITRRFEVALKDGKKSFKTHDTTVEVYNPGDDIPIEDSDQENEMDYDSDSDDSDEFDSKGKKKKKKPTTKTTAKKTAATQAAKNAVSNRNRDLVDRIPLLLGIPPAIMQHVLFLHHEMSFWPLMEDKIVKEKFDVIFASDKYSDALVQYRAQRKELVSAQKEHGHQLQLLQQHWDSYQVVKANLIQYKVASTDNTHQISSGQIALQQLETLAANWGDLFRGKGSPAMQYAYSQFNVLTRTNEQLAQLRSELVYKLYHGRSDPDRGVGDSQQFVSLGQNNNAKQQPHNSRVKSELNNNNNNNNNANIDSKNNKNNNQPYRSTIDRSQIFTRTDPITRFNPLDPTTWDAWGFGEIGPIEYCYEFSPQTITSLPRIDLNSNLVVLRNRDYLYNMAGDLPDIADDIAYLQELKVSTQSRLDEIREYGYGNNSSLPGGLIAKMERLQTEIAIYVGGYEANLYQRQNAISTLLDQFTTILQSRPLEHQINLYQFSKADEIITAYDRDSKNSIGDGRGTVKDTITQQFDDILARFHNDQAITTFLHPSSSIQNNNQDSRAIFGQNNLKSDPITTGIISIEIDNSAHLKSTVQDITILSQIISILDDYFNYNERLAENEQIQSRKNNNPKEGIILDTLSPTQFPIDIKKSNQNEKPIEIPIPNTLKQTPLATLILDQFISFDTVLSTDIAQIDESQPLQPPKSPQQPGTRPQQQPQTSIWFFKTKLTHSQLQHTFTTIRNTTALSPMNLAQNLDISTLLSQETIQDIKIEQSNQEGNSSPSRLSHDDIGKRTIEVLICILALVLQNDKIIDKMNSTTVMITSQLESTLQHIQKNISPKLSQLLTLINTHITTIQGQVSMKKQDLLPIRDKLTALNSNSSFIVTLTTQLNAQIAQGTPIIRDIISLMQGAYKLNILLEANSDENSGDPDKNGGNLKNSPDALTQVSTTLNTLTQTINKIFPTAQRPQLQTLAGQATNFNNNSNNNGNNNNTTFSINMLPAQYQTIHAFFATDHPDLFTILPKLTGNSAQQDPKSDQINTSATKVLPQLIKTLGGLRNWLQSRLLNQQSKQQSQNDIVATALRSSVDELHQEIQFFQEKIQFLQIWTETTKDLYTSLSPHGRIYTQAVEPQLVLISQSISDLCKGMGETHDLETEQSTKLSPTSRTDPIPFSYLSQSPRAITNIIPARGQGGDDLTFIQFYTTNQSALTTPVAKKLKNDITSFISSSRSCQNKMSLGEFSPIAPSSFKLIVNTQQSGAIIPTISTDPTSMNITSQQGHFSLTLSTPPPDLATPMVKTLSPTVQLTTPSTLFPILNTLGQQLSSYSKGLEGAKTVLAPVFKSLQFLNRQCPTVDTFNMRAYSNIFLNGELFEKITPIIVTGQDLNTNSQQQSNLSTIIKSITTAQTQLQTISTDFDSFGQLIGNQIAGTERECSALVTKLTQSFQNFTTCYNTLSRNNTLSTLALFSSSDTIPQLNNHSNGTKDIESLADDGDGDDDDFFDNFDHSPSSAKSPQASSSSSSSTQSTAPTQNNIFTPMFPNPLIPTLPSTIPTNPQPLTSRTLQIVAHFLTATIAARTNSDNYIQGQLDTLDDIAIGTGLGVKSSKNKVQSQSRTSTPNLQSALSNGCLMCLLSICQSHQTYSHNIHTALNTTELNPKLAEILANTNFTPDHLQALQLALSYKRELVQTSHEQNSKNSGFRIEKVIDKAAGARQQEPQQQRNLNFDLTLSQLQSINTLLSDPEVSRQYNTLFETQFRMIEAQCDLEQKLLQLELLQNLVQSIIIPTTTWLNVINVAVFDFIKQHNSIWTPLTGCIQSMFTAKEKFDLFQNDEKIVRSAKFFSEIVHIPAYSLNTLDADQSISGERFALEYNESKRTRMGDENTNNSTTINKPLHLVQHAQTILPLLNLSIRPDNYDNQGNSAYMETQKKFSAYIQNKNPNTTTTSMNGWNQQNLKHFQRVFAPQLNSQLFSDLLSQTQHDEASIKTKITTLSRYANNPSTVFSPALKSNLEQLLSQCQSVSQLDTVQIEDIQAILSSTPGIDPIVIQHIPLSVLAEVSQMGAGLGTINTSLQTISSILTPMTQLETIHTAFGNATKQLSHSSTLKDEYTAQLTQLNQQIDKFEQHLSVATAVQQRYTTFSTHVDALLRHCIAINEKISTQLLTTESMWTAAMSNLKNNSYIPISLFRNKVVIYQYDHDKLKSAINEQDQGNTQSEERGLTFAMTTIDQNLKYLQLCSTQIFAYHSFYLRYLDIMAIVLLAIRTHMEQLITHCKDLAFPYVDIIATTVNTFSQQQQQSQSQSINRTNLYNKRPLVDQSDQRGGNTFRMNILEYADYVVQSDRLDVLYNAVTTHKNGPQSNTNFKTVRENEPRVKQDLSVKRDLNAMGDDDSDNDNDHDGSSTAQIQQRVQDAFENQSQNSPGGSSQNNINLTMTEKEITNVLIRLDHQHSMIPLSLYPLLEKLNEIYLQLTTSANKSVSNYLTDLTTRQNTVENGLIQCDKALSNPPLNSIVAKYNSQRLVVNRLLPNLIHDLDKYCKALDKALLQYHELKLSIINAHISQFWQECYTSNDITDIYIKADTSIRDNADVLAIEMGDGTAAAAKGKKKPAPKKTTTRKKKGNDDGDDSDVEEISPATAPVIAGSAAARKYTYHICGIQNGEEVDLRGRCSAGQRALICLLIRLALSMTFCASWGSVSSTLANGGGASGGGKSILLTLDEPTANLDAEHCTKFAEVLSNLIDRYTHVGAGGGAGGDDLDGDIMNDFDSDNEFGAGGGGGGGKVLDFAGAITRPGNASLLTQQARVQFIIITHDHDFVESLGTRGICDSYYRVYKNKKAYSQIKRIKFADYE